GTCAHFSRDPCFNISHVTRRLLTPGFSRVIPNDTQPRLSVSNELVQLDISQAAIRIALLVVPAHTEIQLHGPRNFEFILNVVAKHSCARIRMKLKVANTRTEPHQKGIIVGLICGNRTRWSNG